MITRENYSMEHIRNLQESSKRDPNLIERVLFAFGLLEALRRVELPFIFKGGIKKVIINGEDNIEIVWNTDDPFFK